MGIGLNDRVFLARSDCIVEWIKPFQTTGAVEQGKGDRAILELLTDSRNRSLLGEFVNQRSDKTLLVLQLLFKELPSLLIL
jgi:hypothetical protein